MTNILIYTENYYFRLGLSQMITITLLNELEVHFYYEFTHLSDIDYIFVDATIDKPLTCLSILRRKRKDTFMFILNEKSVKNKFYIPPCYLNTLNVKKCACIDETIFQLRTLFSLRSQKFSKNITSLCHCCIFNRKLSTQQIKIIALLAKGFTCSAITNKMKISYKTVQTHKNRIMNKYKIKTKHELYTLLRYFYEE